MIHLDYLLVIGILLSILLFLLVGVFYYSKSNLLKGLNIWFLIILSALLSYLLYPLYELTDYREEFTSIVIIAAIIIKIIINLSIFMIADVNVNIRMYNFDDVQCTVIPPVAYGFVTGMNLQLC